MVSCNERKRVGSQTKRRGQEAATQSKKRKSGFGIGYVRVREIG